ncbi:hypothetical protein FRACYDRAFT_263549 [Fragilariopsis cylindrus CCMP1102]|uniref:Fatty acid hydroxylase domain-containing protein n=1 Tax=Fragilariopsis cylindrus CCMP1102 TaxID=635003 RepID=A0A1E7EZD8_9STRA|nr:hypothetical protein FRACYDRAFT_263549 [Fragilariopsis cylindrus CCMP1102]|eukprot:OEU11370.1 hypothetical protein FRACYDRAFT_263549 [Fragilariopsis cylindrus CCMP1102]
MTSSTNTRSSSSSRSRSSSSTIFDRYPILNGIGGLSHGSFFRIQDSSVLQEQERGQGGRGPTSESLAPQLYKIMIGESFIYSPNLTWLIMSVYNANNTNTTNVHVVQLQPQLQDVIILLDRIYINLFLALSYITFWHCALYFWGYCNRPFVSNRIYNIHKVLHNIFYTVLGIFQWTIVEGMFIYLYKSKKLPYCTTTITTNDNSTENWNWNWNILFQTLILSILVPSYRDIHFYFTHRFIHIRCLYKYIHSVHHRNTDIEPFAGLAMHPIEHLYYFTCYGPLLILPTLFQFKLHPFLLFWMGMHVIITPAASHSGYEDHFSADILHYLHHRYCECNYSAGINFDSYFGTYRNTLAVPQKQLTFKVVVEEEEETTTATATKLPPAPPADPKSTLIGWYYPEHIEYQLDPNSGKITMRSSMMVIYSIPFGPLLWAFILGIWTAPTRISWRKMFLAPFDKDSTFSLVLHFGLGFILGVLPISYLLYLHLI